MIKLQEDVKEVEIVKLNGVVSRVWVSRYLVVSALSDQLDCCGYHFFYSAHIRSYLRFLFHFSRRLNLFLRLPVFAWVYVITCMHVNASSQRK